MDYNPDSVEFKLTLNIDQFRILFSRNRFSLTNIGVPISGIILNPFQHQRELFDVKNLKSPYNKWIEICKQYRSQGLLVRVFADRFTTVEAKLRELYCGKVSSASLLLPGVSMRLFEPKGCFGAGLIFAFDEHKKLAMFSKNAYVQDPCNVKHTREGKYNNLRDPKYENRTIKNHYNNYSLIKKIYEKRACANGLLENITSGHITSSGDFVHGKRKHRDSKIQKTVNHNELVIGWKPGKKRILGFIVQMPVSNEKLSMLNRIVEFLKFRKMDLSEFDVDDIPVVSYDSKMGVMKYLGTTEENSRCVKLPQFSKRPFIETHDGFELYLKSVINDTDEHEHITVDYSIFRGLQPGQEIVGLDRLSLPKELSTGTSAERSEHTIKHSLKKRENTIKLRDILSKESFHDNLQRLIDFLVEELNKEIKKGNRFTNREIIKLSFYKSLLTYITLRQFFESFDLLDITDPEAIMFSFLVIVKNARSIDPEVGGKFIELVLDNPCINGNLKKMVMDIIYNEDKDFESKKTNRMSCIINYALETSEISSNEVKKNSSHIYDKFDKLIYENFDSPADKLTTLRNILIRLDDLFHKLTCNDLSTPPLINSKFTDFENCKVTTWYSLFLQLQINFQKEVVNKVNAEKAGSTGASKFTASPYEYMDVIVPSNMNVIDLVLAGDTSPFVSVIAAYYAFNKCPRPIGTIDSKNVTLNMKKAIEKEVKKQPSNELLQSIKSSVPSKVRSWEVVQYPASNYSPLDGFDNVNKETHNKVFYPEKIDFVGIDVSKLEIVDSTKPTDGDILQAEECTVCKVSYLKESVGNQKKEVDSQNIGQLTKTNCDHIFHRGCFNQWIRTQKTTCPYCRQPQTDFNYGLTQPKGSMSCKIDDKDKKFIKITYKSPESSDDTMAQRPKDARNAYLPFDEKGLKALAMLKTAYQRGLILTVGFSFTRQMDNVVVWADVPHKTCTTGGPDNHAYPDEGYLDRLTATLIGLGIDPH